MGLGRFGGSGPFFVLLTPKIVWLGCLYPQFGLERSDAFLVRQAAPSQQVHVLASGHLRGEPRGIGAQKQSHEQSPHGATIAGFTLRW